MMSQGRHPHLARSHHQSGPSEDDPPRPADPSSAESEPVRPCTYLTVGGTLTGHVEAITAWKLMVVSCLVYPTHDTAAIRLGQFEEPESLI